MNDRRLKIEQRVLLQAAQALLLLTIALLQTSLAPTLWRFRPDWVLIAVAGWALLRGLLPGLSWAVYGGLSLDILGTQPIGSHLLVLVLCVLAIAFVTEPLDRDHPLLILLVMLLSALGYTIGLLLIQSLVVADIPWSSYVFTVILPIALVDTIVAIPSFALLRRVERRGRPVVSL